jgi:ubiquinone/menaquinone biosynthesis C-methylase UbiE
MSDIVRGILEFGEITVKNKLKEFVHLLPKDKILEVGCGTGSFSKLFNARYFGIDNNIPHLNHAQKKYAGAKKKFFLADAFSIGFVDKSFDVSFLLSVIHHLPEEAIYGILKEVNRVTKNQLVIVDLVPSDKDLVRKFFYSLDVGKHIRPLDKQLEIVGQVFNIRHHETFRSGVNIHSLIIATPK